MEKELKRERLITQAEYARKKGISRPRVSQMIKEKKLTVVWISGAKLVYLNDKDFIDFNVADVKNKS